MYLENLKFFVTTEQINTIITECPYQTHILNTAQQFVKQPVIK